MSNLVKLPTEFINDILTPEYQGVLTAFLDTRKDVFIRNCIALATMKSELINCTPESVRNSLLTAAALNLDVLPQFGQAWVIPYKNNRQNTTEAQFLLGYIGLKALAIRTGQYRIIAPTVVFPENIVEINPFTGNIYNWNAEVNTPKPCGYASFYQLTNGYQSHDYMSAADMESHARRFSAEYRNALNYGKADKTFWHNHRDAMALKTISKRHLKSSGAPMSADMGLAMIADGGVIKSFDTVAPIIEYPDNDNDQAPQ